MVTNEKGNGLYFTDHTIGKMKLIREMQCWQWTMYKQLFADSIQACFSHAEDEYEWQSLSGSNFGQRL